MTLPLQSVRSLLAPPQPANELDRRSTVIFTAPASHGELLATASAVFLHLFSDVFSRGGVPDFVGVLRVFNQYAVSFLQKTHLPRRALPDDQ